MYQVGNKVRIISDLIVGNVHGYSLSVIPDMVQYRDTIQEIERIWDNPDCDGTRYKFKDIQWSWLDCHFEPIIEGAEFYEYW